jgi:prephenate dehydrogenase
LKDFKKGGLFRVNEESDFTGFTRITIIGCGLIGGSIALALKENQFPGQIFGIDRKEVLEKAIECGAIDRGSEMIEEGVIRYADIVILATPVKDIIELLPRIKPFLSKECLVTDTGSTKIEIMKKVNEVFSNQYDFIGGHPMAGLEKGGIEYARADLFSEKPYITVSRSQQSEASFQKMSCLLQMLGAFEIKLTASEHDKIIALVSHVPQLISVIITNMLGQLVEENYNEKCFQIGGNAFNELTRIASSPFSMWGDIFLTNKKSIISFIDQLEEMLAIAKKKVDTNPYSLEEDFIKASYFKEKM